MNESYGYSNDRLQMTSQTATKGSTLMSLNYSYAASAGASGVGTTTGNTGQLMSIAAGSTINTQPRNQAFSYDNVGRLVTASGWSAWGRRFAYDRWGNRTGMWNAVAGGSQLQNIAIATTGGVANNRIANVNGVTYTYDWSGNCTADGAHSYQYDAEGRQVNVDSGATATSAYDSSNWRVKKVAGGVTTHYVWEGAQVIAEYNGSTGALISEYIFAGSSMIREQGAATRYYHRDRLSTRLITDGSGTVMGTEDHFPFGEDTGTGTGESEKHRFTSYERDSESGSDYAVNRQHQYANGKFMQPDPIGGSIGVPQSLNRFAYVVGDPVNLSDPLGLDWTNDASIRGPGVLLDRFEMPQAMWGMVFNLWAIGAADMVPDGVEINARGEWVLNDHIIDNPNDYWRALPQDFIRGTLWNNASEAIQGRLEDLIRKILDNQRCVDWFKAHSAQTGRSADLRSLFGKTGMNFYLSGDQVSTKGLEGLNTGKLGVRAGFGQTLFGGTSSPQVVINRSAFDSLNNPGIAGELIHEMFHAAGLRGSNPKGSGFLGLFRPNDLNPQVTWADIQKNCVDGFQY